MEKIEKEKVNKMTNELSVLENNKKEFIGLLPTTTEEKKVVYNALESCDKLLNDCVGDKIKIKNVYIQERSLDNNGDTIVAVDNETGEVIEADEIEKAEKVKSKYRIILIGEDGKTYATGSYGVYNSLMRLFALYGTPQDWSEPLEVEIVKRDIDKERKMLALKLV